MFHMFCSMFFIIFNTYRLQSVCLEGLKQPRAELPKGAKMSETRAGENCMYTNMYHLISPSPAIWIHMGVSEHGLCPKTIQKHGFTTTIQMLKFR